MSTSIDNRIVEMQFDNAQFEANVKTSISTLDRLKSALNLDGAGRGLENISTKANNINMNGLSNAVDTVINRFSALGTIATGALLNIGRQIESTATRMIKSLTVDNISAGFNEYELKMGSIQTIMAGTGESLETVNKYLNELNEYSDKTIYSFADMTDNIGKFTNAGVKLDDAVAAIKGIANEAALSGANASQASHAMYNFAQALSAGYVKLIDWKSIENAQMATVSFKNELLSTAEALGTVTKQADGTYKTLAGNTLTAEHNFNDSLKDQWMTTEVLTQTLAKYANETTEIGKKATEAATEVKTFSMMIDTVKEAVGSTWAHTWELIFGDFEEGKKLWTGMSKILEQVFTGGGEIRNQALEKWKDSGGREILLQGFKNLYYDLKLVTEPIHQAFAEVFDINDNLVDKIATALLDVTKKFKDLTLALAGDESRFNRIREVFKGVWTAVKLLGEGFRTVTKLLKPFLTPIIALASKILDFAVYISQLVQTFDKWIHSSKEASTAFEKLGKAIQFFANALTLIITGGSMLGDIFLTIAQVGGNILLALFRDLKVQLDNFLKPVKEFINSKFGTAFTDLKIAIENLDFKKALDAITKIINKVKELPVVANVLKALKTVGLLVAGALFVVGNSIYTFISNIINTIRNGGITALFNAIVTQLVAIKNNVLALFNKDTITNKLKSISDYLKSFFGKFSISKKIREIKDSISNLISNSPLGAWFNNLKSIVSSASEPFKFITDALWNFIKTLTPAKIGVLAFGGAILGLIINVSRMTSSFANVGNAARDFLTVLSGGSIGKKPNIIRDLALAIGVLAGSLALLAMLDQNKLNNATNQLLKLMGAAVALTAFSAILTALKSKIGNTDNPFEIIAKAMLALAGSVLIMVIALKVLQSISLEGIVERLAILIAIMGSLALIASILSYKAPQLTKGAILLVAFGFATKMLVDALAVLNGMQPEGLKEKVLALVEIMGALAILSMGVGHIGLFSAVGLIAMVWALKLVLPELNELAGYDLGNIKKLIEANIDIFKKMVVALGIMMVIESITGKGMKNFGAGLILMAGSILILTGVVKLMADMKPADVKKGTSFIASCLGMFALLAIASKFTGEAKFGRFALSLIPITACIFALSLIVRSLGDLKVEQIRNGTVALGAIVGMIAILAAVSALTKDAKTVTVLGLVIGIAAIAYELMWLSTIPWDNLKNGIIAFGAVVGSLALALLITSKLGKVSLLGALSAVLTLGSVIAALMVIQNIPVDKLTAQANALSTLFLALSGAAFILGKAGSGDGALLNGLKGIGVAIAFVTALVGVGVALNWLNQYTDIEAGLDMAVTLGGKIGEMIGSFTGGIGEGITNSLPTIGTNLSDFANNASGFFSLISGGSLSGAASGVKDLAQTFLTIAETDFVNRLTSIFGGEKTSMADFGAQLVDLGSAMVGYSNTVAGNIDSSAIESSAAAASILVGLANTLPNSGGWLGAIFGENDWATFSAGLVDFGTAMVRYGEIVNGAGLDENTFTASSNAAAILVDLANTLPNSGGLAGAIFGDNDWTSFTKGLVNFGFAMVRYGEIVNGANLNETTFAASSNAAAMLVDLQNSFPDSGGAIAALFGDNTWTTFSEGLEAFGTAMVNYADTVGGGKLDAGAIASSATAAENLVTLADKIPDGFGGKLSSLFGGDSWSNFGDGLGEFGEQLKAYSKNVAGLTTEDAAAIKNSADAGKALADLADKLPDDFTASISTIFGSISVGSGSSWSNLGEGLADFADAIIVYSNKITGQGGNIDSTAIRNSATSVSALVEVIKTIQGSGLNGLDLKWGNNFKDFGDLLLDFADVAKNYATKVAGFNWGTVQTSATEMTKLFNLFSNISKSDFSSSEKLTSFGQAINSLGTIGVDQFCAAFTGSTVTVTAAMDTMVTAATTELGLKNPEFKTAGTSAITEFANGLKNSLALMTEAAQSAIDGFIQGIEANKASIFTEGGAIGDEFLSGVRSTTGWNSPWSTMIQAAHDAIEGLKSGFADKNSELSGLGVEVGDRLLNAFRDTVGWHSDWASTKEAGRDGIDGLIDGARERFPNLMKAIDEGGKAIEGKITEVTNAVSSVTGKPGDWLSSEGLYNMIMGNVVDTEEKVEEAAKEASEAIDGEGKSASNATAANGNYANSLSKAGSKAKAATKDIETNTKANDELLDVLSYGGGVIKEFERRFGAAAAEIGDTTPLEASKKAVEALAIATYEASKKADEVETTTGKKVTDSAKKRLEDIKKAFVELQTSLKSTISGQMDIFKEFDRKTETSAADMLKNMQSQVAGVTDWSNAIEELAARGIDQGLLKKLAELGPQGYDYVNAFVQMTGDQLAQANQLYATSLQIPETATNQIMASYAYTGLNAIQGFAKGVSENQAAMDTSVVNAVSAAADAGAIEASGEHTKNVGAVAADSMGVGITDNVSLPKNAAEGAISDSTDAASAIAQELGPKSGYYLDVAVANGIDENASVAIEAAARLANAINSQFMRSEAMASPSKIWAGFGRYLVLGLANSMNDNSGLAVGAAEGLSGNINNAFTEALNSFTTFFNEDMDLDPTIRPILDLSEAQKQSAALSSMFDPRMMDVAASLNGVQAPGARMTAAMANMQQGNTTNMGGFNITINTQPGMDPNDIANAVSQEIYRAMMSREAVAM